MSNRFPTPVYAERLSRAQELARSHGLAGLVIGTGPQFAYLTGSWLSTHERLTALVIPSTGTPHLFAPSTDIADLANSAVPELPIKAIGWVDGERPQQLVVNILTAAAESPPVVAVDPLLSADHLLSLQRILPGWDIDLTTVVLSELFLCKDSAEIDQLRGANHAIDRVHAQVPELLIPGRTEREVASDIEKLILIEHEAVDFIIVGSGPHGANPHHSFSDRILQSGELVVVDIGGTYGVGYHSDCTRTYVVGGDVTRVDPVARAMYTVLENAQAATKAAVRPGISAAQIDQIARSLINAAGFGAYFFHRTGHGIGLSTHEEPFIMAGNDLILEPGMAFSIEPGIYLPDRYGARIEDILVVTSTGHECLTRQQTELR